MEAAHKRAWMKKTECYWNKLQAR